jgi:hypothetical protein
LESSSGTQVLINRLRRNEGSKAVSLFKKAIPEFWMEILENDSPTMFSVMGSFGSLAALLYFRLSNLCKEQSINIIELKQVQNCLGKRVAD